MEACTGQHPKKDILSMGHLRTGLQAALRSSTFNRSFLAGHLDQKIFLRRIGLLLYSRSDPFPLTVPRWRWGIRILQGKGSLPLGNNPRPGGSIKILSWALIGSSSLKTTSELLIVPFIPTIIIFPKSSARSKKSERTKGRLICLTLAF